MWKIGLTINFVGVKIIGVTIFLLILAGIQGRTQTNIHVDGLHNFTTINTDPELNIKYRFEANESLGIFKLKCSSIEPVEWVFDDLTVKLEHRLEWTERKMQSTSVFNYEASIEISNYQFKELSQDVEDQFVCRSVSNHFDNILLILRRGQNVTDLSTQRYIHVIEKLGDDKPLQSTAKELQFAVNVTFNVIQSGSFGHFFQCQLNDGTLGRIEIEKCSINSAAYCANTLRYLKMKEHHLNLTHPLTVPIEVLLGKENWVKLSNKNSGVAVCIDDTKPKSPRVGAIEYFYEFISVPSYNLYPPPLYQNIYFSWANVVPNEQVLLRLWKSTFRFEEYYFRNDAVLIECKVPIYGFSHGSFLQIAINGSVILEETGFDIIWLNWDKMLNYNLSHGPGEYEFKCVAPVWNTTEWANYSKTITVLDPVAPYFNQSYTEMSVQSGNSMFQITLYCIAEGLPVPEQVSWYFEKEKIPELQDRLFVHMGPFSAKLQKILLRKSSQFKEIPANLEISCQVQNIFGQEATKAFKIIYFGDQKGWSLSSLSTITSYSVLAKPFANELAPDKTLDVITAILCTISIPCLLISIWILCTVKSDSSTRQVMNRITIHLCVCLAIANTMTLLFMDKTHFALNSTFCYLSGAFTHYILLCAFLLMGMEAIYLYKLTVKVFQSGTNYSVIQYSLVYIIPALIVGCTMLIGVLNLNNAYGNDIFCWLNGYYLIGAFVIPGGIVLLANLALLSTALYHASARKRQFVTLSYHNQPERFIKKNNGKTTKKKLEILAANLFWAKSVFALCVLFGITWIFGWFLLLSNETLSKIAAYCFTLPNASQGIFILLFHCIGNTNIRKDLVRKIQSWTIYKKIRLLVKPNSNKTNVPSGELEL